MDACPQQHINFFGGNFLFIFISYEKIAHNVWNLVHKNTQYTIVLYNMFITLPEKKFAPF